MKLLAYLRSLADALFHRSRIQGEIEEEFRSHIQYRVDDLEQSGLTRAEAERRARIEFGGYQRSREECREAMGGHLIETVAQDVRIGVRMLRRSPGFTAVAVLTLALGIGGNTAIFSIVNGVLLNPLPFPQPDRLVALGESKPHFENGSISYPNFLDWQRGNHAFSSMAVSRGYGFSLTGRGDAEQVNAEFVSADFFPLLGVNPILGRTFTSAEEQAGAGPVAMISEGLWRRKFNAAPDVLSKNVTLDGRDFTIVGVVPAGFHLRLPSFRESDVYAPVRQWSNPLLMNRGAGLGFHGVGRLKPGVTVEQARADMDVVTRNLAATFPDTDRGIGASIAPLKEQMVGYVRPFLFVLLAAVGFVLLIACVNVASLLLARSATRRREFAVRTALGASRGRIIHQLLTESVLLGMAAGGIGLLMAIWGTRAGLKFLPAALPRANEIGLDFRVLAFTTVISLMVGVLFGLVPALRSLQSDPHTALKEGGRGASGGHHGALSTFVVAEMAIALVLLIGAGLMVRSLTRLWRVDPGFNPQGVLTFNVSMPPSMMKAPPDRIRAAFRELDEKLGSATGVTAVSQTWGAFPMGSDDEQLFWLDGYPKPANENDMNWAVDYMVEPDYLKVMETPLKRGRFFTAQDNAHSPLVAVVDEIFARQYFPDQDPIGKRIVLNNSGKALEIVGVVAHVKQWGLDLDDTNTVRAQLYLPCMQMPDDFIAMTPAGSGVVVRYEGSMAAAFDSIRRTSKRMSSEQVIFGDQAMGGVISDSMATRRFAMILLGAFAALALGLASVGIYGVIAYVVGQRTQEIGIRMALGAQQKDVLRLVLWQGTRLALLGVVIGLGVAMVLTRLMTQLLYGVSATDPATFVGLALMLTAIAVAACCIPARRAMRVDPVVALRHE
ncbi:putative permease [Edaphobacter aggregans]|uniref:Putative permease n=1 Tax=Edaphobacter aggregans TaxID=570835 RepID=A0A428MNB0_9BACT|nr:ABC transporter permease [Edaphobacter aggregans]RSL18345.1 putative permease [Edaphobacter aggregans]